MNNILLYPFDINGRHDGLFQPPQRGCTTSVWGLYDFRTEVGQPLAEGQRGHYLVLRKVS